MTPSPSLQDLIDSVRADAPGDDPLLQLAQASRAVAELEELTDALLGHFVDQCRRAGHSWSEISGALGVSKQAAHKRFSAPTFERFTPRARWVLEAAADEARTLGHHYVGTEHLLLALYGQPDGVAAQVLVSSGVTRQACEEQIRSQSRPGSDPGDGSLPFTPKAVDVLRGAVEEALRLGHNYIGTEHLLLSLLRDPESLAARVVADQGLTYDAARERTAVKLAEFTRPRNTTEGAG